MKLKYYSERYEKIAKEHYMHKNHMGKFSYTMIHINTY